MSQMHLCLQSHMSRNTSKWKEQMKLEMNVTAKEEIWEEVCKGGHILIYDPLWKDLICELKTSNNNTSKTNL